MAGLPNVNALLRRHFFAGLLVVVPLGVIAWIAQAALLVVWQLPMWLPEEARPESPVTHLGFAFGITAVLVLAISVLGWVSSQYLGRKLLELIAEVIRHIPVLRSIYGALDQFLRTMASGGGQQFSRVVYVEYPRKGCWALAFVTSPARGPNAPAAHLNVYVPTTPNPTSGFHLIVPEAEVRESGMKVEEAFRTILSLGIAQPPNPGSARGGS